MIATLSLDLRFPGITLGARGLVREIWKNTRLSTLSEIGELNTTAQDYRSEVITEASSPSTQSSFGESTSFSERLRGFFVPPSDNNYTFYIQAGGRAELYLSINESASAKVSLAAAIERNKRQWRCNYANL